jgi:hypothetical protein
MTPTQVAQDPHPEISLAKLLRLLKERNHKLYRMKELISQVASFYDSFFRVKDIGSNRVLTAILSEWPTTIRARQRYADPMPVNKVLDWLDNLPAPENMDRFELYRKLVVSIQLVCIARTADIFRLRFDTLTRSGTEGPVTLVTSTKTSKQNGFRFFLFPIPGNPRRCPVRTVLEFQKRWERELAKRKWSVPPGFIHVYKDGKLMTRADQLAKILRDAYEEAGIDVKKWGPNGARHAVITHYLASGIHEKQIKLITGHSMRSSVTQDYYTLPLEDWASKSILARNPGRNTSPDPPEGILGRAERLLLELDEEEVIVEINARPLHPDTSSNATSAVTDRSLVDTSGLELGKYGTIKSQ